MSDFVDALLKPIPDQLSEAARKRKERTASVIDGLRDQIRKKSARAEAMSEAMEMQQLELRLLRARIRECLEIISDVGADYPEWFVEIRSGTHIHD